ncbi:MAG: Nif3-like dinuclear metal center hexameric protein [Phycisphaeraceae bacterium]|nr:Nif3-like dinuclear metal center hexameric protein [Phycisphaeraceae bacterium]
MKLQRLLETFNRIAPESLAEPWDKVGLHLGDPAWGIKSALLCIDLTEAVIDEAVEKGSRLVVAYHPPIFEGLERLTTDHWKSRALLKAAQKRIAIYSPHTALDAATGGVNDWLADGMGEGEVEPIRPTDAATDYKLVAFVPPDALDSVRSALADAGAGQIGDYEQCSFSHTGEGTFFGGASTDPAVGKKGRLERVEERRLEMVCPASAVADIVTALCDAHPYEEPAFDLYRRAADPTAPVTTGQGRRVTLKRPVTLSTMVKRIGDRLGTKRLKVADPGHGEKIQTIALCAGAGGSLLEEAGEIDLFFTGEMRHHDVLDARERGIAVVLAGHTQTERPYLATLRRRLAAEAESVDWAVSKADTAAAQPR